MLSAGCVVVGVPDRGSGAPLAPERTGGFVEVGKAAGLDVVLGEGLVPTGSLMGDARLPDGSYPFASPDEASPAASNPDGAAPDVDGADPQEDLGSMPRILAPGSPMVTLTGGVALRDFDLDGDLDIAFAQPGKTILFANDGTGHFTDVSWLLPTRAHWNGTTVLWWDYDNDGRPDLYLGEQTGPAFLYHNERASTGRAAREGLPAFVDVTAAMGFTLDLAVQGASAADINNDGRLDLLVVGYTKWWENDSPLDMPGEREHLYVSQPDGTYHEEGLLWGLNETDPGLGAAFADIDLDGRQDVYVTNDFSRGDVLWRNTGGAFRDATRQTGTASARDGMGATWFDADTDGYLDLYISNIYALQHEPLADVGNQLFLNNANATFQDVSLVSRSVDAGWAWGSCAFDVDADGDMDLYVPGGFPQMGVPPPPAPGQRPPVPERMDNLPQRLFVNDGHANFRDQAKAWGVAARLDGRGCSVGDLDGDGAPDLVAAVVGQRPLLYLNRAPVGNRLRLDLQGTTSNRDAVGARVTVTWPGHRLVQQRTAGAGYLSEDAPTLDFGLAGRGAADLEVDWPSGVHQEFHGAAPRDYTLVEGGTLQAK